MSLRTVGDMGFSSWTIRVFLLLALGALLVAPARAARNDDNVEWDGVYSDETFRSPSHPGAGEDFTLELRVFRGDLTGARIRTFDGETHRYEMSWVRNDGIFDIWRGTVEGSASDFIYYRFELVDGSDTDYFNRLGMSGSPPARGDFLVNTTALGAFPLGATVAGGGTVFRVWAPNAERVSVAGSFNNWSESAHPLTNVRGYWQGRVVGARVNQRYKFAIHNGETLWRTDPYARRQVSSVGDSVIWSSDYQWGDEDWVTPFFEDLVIYELHVGTFTGGGDGVEHHPGRFRDVVDTHLDHLVELGINAIGLMPLMEFAGELSWGYNPSFQFAPESSYGSPDDLKYLVDRCHQRGIAVLLDVVYNHMGGSDLAGNLLDYDGEEIYFYPEGNGYRETPWGPRPDYGRAEVRQYIRDSVRMWLEEYHIDGLRVDGTDFIKVNTEGWRLMQEITQTVDTVSRKAVVIAEQLPNDPAVTVPIEAGGAGLDSQWNDLFHDNLRDALGAAAFGDPNMGALAAGMNHFAFGGVRAVNYIESHDEVAVHGRVTRAADGENSTSAWAQGRGKLCWGLVMFTSGIPMVLQGQELLETRAFGDTREHNIRWDRRERYDGYFNACRDMTRLRRSLPALRADGRQNIFHVNDEGNVIAWQRWTDRGDDLVIVASFNNEDFSGYCLGMPGGGQWHEIFNSDSELYDGRNRGNGGRISAAGGGRDGLPSSACITLPRMGVLVFAREPLPPAPSSTFLRGDCNGDEKLDISDAARHIGLLFQGGVSTDCPAACDTNGDSAGDISDAIYTLNFLFLGRAAPPAPWPECGPVQATLDCDRSCN
ncbi:MAG: alpha-amylase family glycosyl hydrolase [Planctomycetota bacterium]|nr:alpha-amylase family glycosyl hydrolase [Planctomycetota bacterium]